MVFIHVVYGYMYDVNFPLLELGEAISFLFQCTLVFCWVSGKLFYFFGGNYGFTRGSSALRWTTWATKRSDDHQQRNWERDNDDNGMRVVLWINDAYLRKEALQLDIGRSVLHTPNAAPCCIQ